MSRVGATRWSRRGLGPSPVNNHLASLAGFWGWAAAQAPGGAARRELDERRANARVGAAGAAGADAGAGTVAEERRRPPRALHAPKGRRNDRGEAQHGHARAMCDRAILYVLLSTGLRREELVTLDVTQVSPCEPGLLRKPSGRG
jgi:integrase